MRTTLTLEDDVVKALEREMRKSGDSLKTTVNRLLRTGLAAPARTEAPFVIEARNMGARPGINFDKISALVEMLEGPLHK